MNSLSTKDKENLTKQASEVFKLSVCWNEYKTKCLEMKNDNESIKNRLDSSFKV